MTPEARSKYFKQLVHLGYADSVGEVWEYLADREIDDLLRAGVLTPLKKQSKGGN